MTKPKRDMSEKPNLIKRMWLQWHHDDMKGKYFVWAMARSKYSEEYIHRDVVIKAMDQAYFLSDPDTDYPQSHILRLNKLLDKQLEGEE